MNIKPLIPAIAFAVLMIGGSLGLKYAEHAGLVSHDLPKRAVCAAIGLYLVVQGNFMPKNMGRVRDPEMARRMQSALRVGGWSFALGGLVYAGLWAFAPIDAAGDLSILVIGAAMVVAVAYAVWACALAPRQQA